MDASYIAELFAPWRDKHARAAWKPVVAESHTGPFFSWFGGEPTASPNNQWPACKQCQKEMRFFLQLAFTELPAQTAMPLKDRIVQLFYCSTDDGSCETWAPFSGTHHLRVVQPDHKLLTSPPAMDPFPRKVITGWAEIRDTPDPAEHEACGLSYKYDFKKELVDVRCEDPAIVLENANIKLDVAEAISISAPGDKLGGWPYWVQSVEYPLCPQCQAQMHLLLQIDSEDNLPYMFGDAGCAHLTYCPNHPETFAFGWACG